MPTPIEVEVGRVRLRGELGDTACARAIAESLPLECRIHTWGEEFYFEIPVREDLDETATSAVDVGTLGYWPPGRALAIFFGPTPMSTSDRPVPASDVNIVGRLEDARRLAGVMDEETVSIHRLE